MKKLLVIFIAFFCVEFSGTAQDTIFNNTVCANAGFAFRGLYFKSLDVLLEDSLEVSNKPAIQFTYDNSIRQWISLGGAISYQPYQFQYVNFQSNIDSSLQTYNSKVGLGNIAFRVLFHYSKKQNLDLYSGLRINIPITIRFSTNEDNSRDELLPSMIDILPQIIPFGLRYYFKNDFGISGEVGIGTPHFISLGLAKRLQ